MRYTELNMAVAKELGISVSMVVSTEHRFEARHLIVSEPSPLVQELGLRVGDEFDPARNLNIAMELAIKRCADIKIHQITVAVYPMPDQPVTGQVDAFRNKRECLAYTICRALI